jgi:hypothetical protein
MAFDPYIGQLKALGFDVDTFNDADKKTVLTAIAVSNLNCN